MIPYEAAWGSSSSKKLKIKMNPAVYLAALLIEEGYAEPARHGYIQFLSKSGKAKGGRIDDGTSRHSQENVKAKAARKKRRPKTPCTIPGPVEVRGQSSPEAHSRRILDR